MTRQRWLTAAIYGVLPAAIVVGAFLAWSVECYLLAPQLRPYIDDTAREALVVFGLPALIAGAAIVVGFCVTSPTNDKAET